MPGPNFVVDVPVDGNVAIRVEDTWGEEHARKITGPSMGSEAGGDDAERASLSFDAKHMKVKQIKEMLRERGLPVSGNKAELVARLMREG